jgi:hypothetical protein
MARAGFCKQCQAWVWVTPADECQFGHPSCDVSGIHDAPTADSQGGAEPGGVRRRANVWPAVGLTALVLLVLASGAVTWFAVTSLVAGTQPSVPREWTSRAAADYPGWRPVGFRSFQYDGSDDPPETDYVLRVVPPGRAFNVGVMYQTNRGSAPRSDDEVLRQKGSRHDLSGSLLDYLERNYINRGNVVVWVTSSSDGAASVNWEPAASIGSPGDHGGTDDLQYLNGKWVLSP